MMDYVFAPPPRPSLAVAGISARFPLRRIFCVGRNYAAHAREMGKDPDREPPFFFTKPADAAVDAAPEDHLIIPYPPESENLHHEIELAIAIGKPGKNIAVDDSLGHVFGYATSVDLTRRDLQGQAKEMGRPWDWGKGFDLSAPVASIHPVKDVGHIDHGRIWLKVNGQTKQEGDIRDLIWPVADIISIISHSMTLKAGDLIMTGTPAGVGPIGPGDHVTGGIDRLGEISFDIGAREIET